MVHACTSSDKENTINKYDNQIYNSSGRAGTVCTCMYDAQLHVHVYCTCGFTEKKKDIQKMAVINWFLLSCMIRETGIKKINFSNAAQRMCSGFVDLTPGLTLAIPRLSLYGCLLYMISVPVCLGGPSNMGIGSKLILEGTNVVASLLGGSGGMLSHKILKKSMDWFPAL